MAEEKNYFDYDELLKICEGIGTEEPDVTRLQKKAAELYPERAQLAEEIYVIPGRGRGFRQEDGSVMNPVWTIGGPMLREVGVLEDGRVLKY